MNNENLDNNSVNENQVDSQGKLNIEVFQNILDVHMNLHEATYTSANFLITITGVILTIIIAGVIPNFDGIPHPAIVIIATASLVSLMMSLEVINPQIKNEMPGDTPDTTNFFYYASFLPHYSPANPKNPEECKEKLDEFKNDISRLAKDENYIIDQYATEIYKLSYCVLKPKFKLLRLATRTFMIGIIIGFLLITAQIIHLIFH